MTAGPHTMFEWPAPLLLLLFPLHHHSSTYPVYARLVARAFLTATTVVTMCSREHFCSRKQERGSAPRQ